MRHIIEGRVNFFAQGAKAPSVEISCEVVMEMKKCLIMALALVLVAGCMLAGCGADNSGAPGQGSTSQEQQGTGEQAGNVPSEVVLTVYFAKFSDTDAWLVPVERAVPYTLEVAQAAMRELIQGPDAGSGLRPVIPSSVKILNISVSNGVCSLDLSKEILTDAASIGVSATTEGLLLAAVANTLTEFPTVTGVKLTIEGKSSGLVEGRYVEDFWGHIGLPDVLVRDSDVIQPG